MPYSFLFTLLCPSRFLLSVLIETSESIFTIFQYLLCLLSFSVFVFCLYINSGWCMSSCNAVPRSGYDTNVEQCAFYLFFSCNAGSCLYFLFCILHCEVYLLHNIMDFADSSSVHGLVHNLTNGSTSYFIL